MNRIPGALAAATHRALHSKQVSVVMLVALLLHLWWAGFHEAKADTNASTLDFTSAFEIAKKSSPQILRTNNSLEAAEASLKAAQARLKSRFSLSVTPFDYLNYNQFNDLYSTYYTQKTKSSFGTLRIDQPIKWTDGLLSLNNSLMWRDAESGFGDSSSKSFSNDLYISLQQPVFTYNRRKMELKRLELDLENNQINYSLAMLSMEKQVMFQFFEVYLNSERLKISREELASQETSYNIMNNKVDAGLGKLDDLYQSEVNLASARSSARNQLVTLDNSLDQLKKLLGISLFSEISVDEDVSFQFVPVDLDLAIDHGLKYRLELRQRLINMDLARDDIIRTGANNEFEGSIRLAYGTIGNSEKFGDIYNSPDKNQQFTLSFEIPLWDWGAREQDLRASKAAFANSQLSYEDEKNNITIAIRQAYRVLENQISQIEIARQNVRNSKLTFEINLEKFQNGDLTAKDLEYYQTQLSQKRLDEVTALINYRLALLDMKILSLWDFENDRSVVTERPNEE